MVYNFSSKGKSKYYSRIIRRKSDFLSFINSLRVNKTFNYYYVSHHKCATQYIMKTLNYICQLKQMNYRKFDWRFKSYKYHLKSTDFLYYSDFCSKNNIILENRHHLGFHIIRDPRDILVSMYFSHKYSHRENTIEIVNNRKALNDLSYDDGLKFLINNSGYFKRVCDEIYNWDYSNDKFLNLRFEDFVENKIDIFLKISNHLDLGFSEKEVSNIISHVDLKINRDKSFNNDVKSHYRSGKSMQWKTEMNESIQHHLYKKFKSLMDKLETLNFYQTEL